MDAEEESVGSSKSIMEVSDDSEKGLTYIIISSL